jgi:hypothetical protein
MSIISVVMLEDGAMKKYKLLKGIIGFDGL